MGCPSQGPSRKAGRTWYPALRPLRCVWLVQWRSISCWIGRRHCGRSSNGSYGKRSGPVVCGPAGSCPRAACSRTSSTYNAESSSRPTRNSSPRGISSPARGTGPGSPRGSPSSRPLRGCCGARLGGFAMTSEAASPTCRSFPAGSGSRRRRPRCASCQMPPSRTDRAADCASSGSPSATIWDASEPWSRIPSEC